MSKWVSIYRVISRHHLRPSVIFSFPEALYYVLQSFLPLYPSRRDILWVCLRVGSGREGSAVLWSHTALECSVFSTRDVCLLSTITRSSDPPSPYTECAVCRNNRFFFRNIRGISPELLVKFLLNYSVWSLECGVWIWVCEEIERWPTSLEAARTTVLNFKFVYYQSIRILSKSKVTSGKFENYSGQFFCPRTNGPGAETNHHRFFFFFYIFLIFSFFFFPVSFFPLLLNFNLILDSGVYERHKFSGSKLRCFLQT